MLRWATLDWSVMRNSSGTGSLYFLFCSVPWLSVRPQEVDLWICFELKIGYINLFIFVHSTSATLRIVPDWIDDSWFEQVSISHRRFLVLWSYESIRSCIEKIHTRSIQSSFLEKGFTFGTVHFPYLKRFWPAFSVLYFLKQLRALNRFL